MKLTILPIALLMLITLRGYSQSNYAIKGSAVDTAEKKALLNTSIMVLSAKDSTLNKFTRAAADGSFTINGLASGKFIMVLTYPGYADYTEDFTLDDKTHLLHDFGKINLILKSRLLQDVIIKGQATAIKIKGDTTEFNAKAYVIQPNDKVEDLIRQFPGIQVDKDGKITAQGQTVSKVLLDGEEFFGDDPTLVTKNIRADMVDKVQLYDKKSDQATFTGIDDGVKNKTLNIKLKEGKKSGYFGKADGGIGTDKFYTGQLLFNKFQNKEKISVYGTAANTGKTGLNWDDNQKYADGSGVEASDDGGIFYFSGNSNDLYYNGQGIPVAKTGGAHYDNKWNNDKYSLNGNYKIGALDIDGNKNTISQNNLPGRIINSASNQLFNNSTFRQKADVTYKVQFDTTANLKLAIDGTFKNIKTNTLSIDTSRRGNSTLLNTNRRDYTNDDNQRLFNASVFYTKKLKKKGRTLSVLLSTSANEDKSTGYLNSLTSYYDTTGVATKTDPVDQYKTGNNNNVVFNSNLTYTEPLAKYLALTFNYGLNTNNGSSDQRSFSKSSGGIYNVLVDSLSNYFKLNQVSNQIGANFNYAKGKMILIFGTKAADVSFKQINEYTGDVFKRHFINWNPQVTYTYKFSQQQSLRANYNGSSSQPSIEQIQPVKNNNNPLYITLGNPDLTPSFRNNFGLSYNSYKVLSGQSIYLSGNYSFTTNPIVNNTITDAGGKTTSQYFNLSNKTPHYFYMYANAGRKIKGIELYVGLNGRVNSNTSYNMVNNALNTSNSTTYSGSLSLNKYVQNKYDFYVSFGPTYNINQSSLQSSSNGNGRGLSGWGGFNYYLPKNFKLSSDMEYTYKAKTIALPQDYESALLNVSLAKSFFKEKNLKITASVNDLLNQNNGFNRNIYGSTITEERYTTIKRYFMLSLTYDFTKMGIEATKK